MAERTGKMASEVLLGDCLAVVAGLAAESADLVYVDPPFFTRKTHSLVTRDRATIAMNGNRGSNTLSFCGFAWCSFGGF